MAQNGRRSVLEMLAEFLRELSVLVLVFVPLDLYARGGFSVKRAAAVILSSAVLLTFGIILERRRP